MLALRHNAAPVDDDILTSSGIIHLKNNTTSELLDMQKFSQDQLKRYEQALRTATPCSRNGNNDPSGGPDCRICPKRTTAAFLLYSSTFRRAESML
jgi:hypothetical protein